MAYIVAFIDVKSLDPGGFIEFKVESDQVGERKSGRITTVGRYELPGVPENKIELGDSNQNIWFWWDTLQGKVILSIDVNGEFIFIGNCENHSTGVRSVESTVVGTPLKLSSKNMPTFASYHGPYMEERPESWVTQPNGQRLHMPGITYVRFR